MDLWIRSQDKEQLIKADNVRIKHEYEQKKVNDNYGRICAYINGEYRCSYIYIDSLCLGEYKTKERALEVLDEIQKFIEEFQSVTAELNEYGEVTNVEHHKKVYEMPLD